MPKIKLIILSLLLVTTGCATTQETETTVQHDNTDSTLWFQTAAEYRANAIQTYKMASMQLDTALNKGSWKGMLEQHQKAASLPPAIVLDVDETVLDNSPFQAMMIKTNTEFSSAPWDAWVGMAQAKAVPGAVEFINMALEKGIAVVYLTNRECKQRPGVEDPCPQVKDTAKNLRDVGITSVDEDLVLLKYAKPEWTSEKQSRRVYLADKYRVLMLFGDDFGDFLPNVKKDITPEQRAKLVDKYRDNWGTSWYALPNPTYGSWRSILTGDKRSYLQDY